MTRIFSSTAQLSLVVLQSPISLSCTAQPIPYVVTFATPADVRFAISLGSSSPIFIKQGHNSCPKNCSCAVAVTPVVSVMRVVPQRRNGNDLMVVISVFDCLLNTAVVTWRRGFSIVSIVRHFEYDGDANS